MKRFNFSYKVFILLAISFFSFQSYSQTGDFSMWWGFTDALGNNSSSTEGICDCGTIYVNNESSLNNAPIPSNLNGYYQVSIIQHTPATGTSVTQYLPNIPSSSWLYGDVIALSIPCGLNIDANINGKNINIRFYSSDPGVGVAFPSDWNHGLYLTVGNPPSIDAGPDQSICLGTGTSLAGSGASSYLWTPATGLNNPNITNPFASPSTTTTYTLEGTNNYTDYLGNSFGCSATDQVTINVMTGPNVDLGPDQSLCLSDPWPILQTLPTAQNASWTHNGSSIGSATLLNTAPYQYGTYTATRQGRNGCSSTDQVTISLDPSADLDPFFNLTTFAGTTVYFEANAPSTTGDHYWYVAQSDAMGNVISWLQTTPIGSPVGPNFTSNNFPLDNWYKIYHSVRSAPCNDWFVSSRLEFIGEEESEGKSEHGQEMPVTEEELSMLMKLREGETDQAQQFKVYPNPNNGTFIIELNDLESTASLEVLNLLGQIIHKQDITDKETRIDISNTNTGVYLVHLKIGTKVQTQRLVIE